MRVVVRTVPRVRAHGPEIFQMDFAQAALQVLAHSEVDREFIRPKLTMPGKDSKDERKHLIDWSPESLEKQQQGNHSWHRPRRESKGCVQVLLAVADREEVKGSPEINLSDEKVRHGMSELPVTKFVSQDRQDFFIMHLLHQSIE